MKIRNIFERLDWENSWELIKSTVMWTCTIASFASIAFSDYIKKYFWNFIYIIIIITIVIIIIRGVREIFRKKLILKIRGKDVEILEGDIWTYDNKYIKLIPVNEYFDTEVNEEVIPKTSLHGQFLKSLCKDELEELERIIEKLKEETINDSRKSDKQKRYNIGTGVFFKGEYLLIALSKFDDDNIARLSSSEYIQFLSKLWLLVNKYGVSKEIVIPLIGGGPSNIDGVDFERKQQYLIESILYTFKMSSINTNVSLHIVLKRSDLKNINFIKLKKIFE